MSTYELTLIQDGECSPAKLREMVRTIRQAARARSGEVVYYKFDGRKTLPYSVTVGGKEYVTGAYQYFDIKFSNDNAGATSLSQYLNLHQDVLRYLLVLRDPKYDREKGVN